MIFNKKIRIRVYHNPQKRQDYQDKRPIRYRVFCHERLLIQPAAIRVGAGKNKNWRYRL